MPRHTPIKAIKLWLLRWTCFLTARGDRGEAYKNLGIALTREGEFHDAAKALEKALAFDQNDARAHIFLSAIMDHNGKIEAAKAALRQGIALKPFMVKQCKGKSLARILRVRGVDNSRYTLGLDSKRQYKIKLSGGNFSDTCLTGMNQFSTINFLICGGNILNFQGLPEYDIIMNSIADPDAEGKALQTLSRFLMCAPIRPVINRPDKVMLTTRDGNYRRFMNAKGIVFPKTIRLPISGGDGCEAALAAVEAEGFSYPLLVREPGSQTGRTFEMISHPSLLLDYVRASQVKELYLIQHVYNPFRSRFQRKMRFFCIDGRLYPATCHIDEAWNVHGGNRVELMKNNPWMMGEEKAFVAGSREYIGGAGYDALVDLCAGVGLDFFGLDFNVMDDGRIVIFELNPAMRHNFGHAKNFPYLKPALLDVTNAFNAMIKSKIISKRQSCSSEPSSSSSESSSSSPSSESSSSSSLSSDSSLSSASGSSGPPPPEPDM